MSVQDANGNPNEFFGVSPVLGGIASGAGSTPPSKHTFVGTDPTTQEPTTGAPYQPVAPVPTPIDTTPSPIQVDAGNTGLSDQQLTDLFSRFMQRTPRGRNAGRVIV